ncbi:MAG TPA: dephospho-CoA kinase [Smithella sp.]|nr:dephospho-CoA kinase [Smithella sp.]MDM7987303.1 dephospho-CoA kinase [Smithella sp.]HNY50027.1 dephospho-CoA kinase [Smithella sp.]HOG89784.1 dephospho-CoA kinase [Smithella sp.]
MLNVGLTGGIACGKSTVAGMFVEKGAYLIDFDRLAHQVQEKGKPAWQKIVDYFGKVILAQDGTIDRVKLGNIVFADKNKLAELNKIVHPFVYGEWDARLEKIKRKDAHAIVLADIPLLFEGNKQHLFDLTMLVLIDPEEQINRLIKRNKISRDEAEKRLKSQMPIQEKKALADIVIENRGSISETRKIVEETWHHLLKLEKQKNQLILKHKNGGKND